MSFPFSAHAIDVSPAVDGFVRNGGSIFQNIMQVLDGPGQSDRGIIEFPLNSVCTPVTKATLRLDVFGSVGPCPFNINVYSYAGDGSLTTADYSAGILATNFVFNGTETSVDIDVTSSILTLLNASSDYAGFNLRFEPASSITMNGPFVAFGTKQNPPAGILILECNTVTVPIPALSKWAMILMLLMLVGSAIWMIHRRRISYRRRIS